MREMLQQELNCPFCLVCSEPTPQTEQSMNKHSQTPSISCLINTLGILNLETTTLRVCVFKGKDELGKEHCKEKISGVKEYRSPVAEKQVQQILLFMEQFIFFTDGEVYLRQ